MASNTPGLARLIRFHLVPDVTQFLTEAANSLFDWRPPDLPQDPCFFRPDGGDWLISSSVDWVAFLHLSQDEAATLKSNAPGLELGPMRATMAEAFVGYSDESGGP